MKKIVIRLAFMLYSLISISVLLLAITLPFGMASGDVPLWSSAIIYPMALIICASMPECQNFFDKKDELK